MIQKILLTTTTLLLMSGCVTKEIVYVEKNPVTTPMAQIQQPIIYTQAPAIEIETATFAGESISASPKVSRLVYNIKALSTNSAYLDLNSNQNIKVGSFLNISATPNQTGYLKLIIIDPNGDRKLVLPNSISNGYIKANQTFNTNNNKFALKASKPRGLHYVIAIFSEQNARVVMRQGERGYDAINSDQDLLDILQRIKNGNYGKSHISIFPMRIY